MSLAVGKPHPWPFPRRENRYTRNPDCSRKVHRARIIPDVEHTLAQCRGSRPQSKFSGRIVPAPPPGHELVSDSFIFRAAEDDRPDVELFDQLFACCTKSFDW